MDEEKNESLKDEFSAPIWDELPSEEEFILDQYKTDLETISRIKELVQKYSLEDNKYMKLNIEDEVHNVINPIALLERYSKDNPEINSLDKLESYLNEKIAELKWKELELLEAKRRKLQDRKNEINARIKELKEKALNQELSEDEKAELKALRLELKGINLSLKELPIFNDIKLQKSAIKSKYKGKFEPASKKEKKKLDKKIEEKKQETSTQKNTQITQPMYATNISKPTEVAPSNKDVEKSTTALIPASTGIAAYNEVVLDNKIEEFKNAGKERGASGISFNYIMPILDKYGRIIDCDFYTDTLTKSRYKLFSFAKDPVRAYKVALNEKLRMIEKMQILKSEDNIDLKKCKKNMIEDFKKYMCTDNYDLCVEKMIAIRTAITREEIKTVLTKNEYPLDNYNVCGVTAKKYDTFPPHLNLKLNKSLIFNKGYHKTITDLHPERKVKSNFRIHRMDRHKNRRSFIKRIKKSISKSQEIDR